MSGPHPMDWRTYAGARQLLAEERVGTLMRDVERHEEAEFRESTKHARR